MSYGRDPDRFTRAPGAIASRDNAHPRAARARQAARARATNSRDQVMRTMTYGARGGMSPLGALNLGYQGGSQGGPGTGIRFDTGTSSTPPIPTGPGGGGPIKTPISTKIGSAVGTARQNLRPISTTTQPTPPTRGTTLDPTGGAGDPLPPLPLPPMPVPTRPSAPKPTTVVTGGGGGTWTPPTRDPISPLPMPEPVEIPDVPTTTSSGIDGKTVAILGAAALAAYFILRKGNS